jgi:hypothetical protein
MSQLVRVSSVSHDRLKAIAKKEHASMSLLLDIAVNLLSKTDIDLKALQGSKIDLITETACSTPQPSKVAPIKKENDTVKDIDNLSNRLSKLMRKDLVTI